MAIQYFLNLALNKEKNSISLYKDLLESFKKLGDSDKELKDLFSFLIKEEIKHKKLIERKIRKSKSQTKRQNK